MDDDTGAREEDEFRIKEDASPSGPRFPIVKMIKQEVLFSSCDPDELLKRYGISGNAYSLDDLDDDAVEELTEFVGSNPEHPEASKVSLILARARCNNGFDIYDPENVGSLFESDPACGAIYACNEILDSLIYVMGITEVMDNVSYALCVLRAVQEGIITAEELPLAVELFSYRNRCATEIYPGRPDPGSVEAWKSILFKTMSMMFGKAADGGEKREVTG